MKYNNAISSTEINAIDNYDREKEKLYGHKQWSLIK